MIALIPELIAIVFILTVVPLSKVQYRVETDKALFSHVYARSFSFTRWKLLAQNFIRRSDAEEYGREYVSMMEKMPLVPVWKTLEYIFDQEKFLLHELE